MIIAMNEENNFDEDIAIDENIRKQLVVGKLMKDYEEKYD